MDESRKIVGETAPLEIGVVALRQAEMRDSLIHVLVLALETC